MTKYWRLKLKGEQSEGEIYSAISRSGGKVVRIYSEGGETHVFFAADKLTTAEAVGALGEAAMPEEVSTATAHSGGTPRPRRR
jgi:hypothetical protein